MTVAIQKRPVILLPGWAFPAQVWADMAARLSEFTAPQAVDLPRTNGSVADVDSILEHSAQQLLARAPESALWIGWSLGGLVAAHATQLAPERVAALVLVACTPKFVSSPDWPYATTPDVLDGFQGSLDGDRSGTLRRFAALCSHNGRRVETAVVRTLSQAMKQTSERDSMTLASGLEILRHVDLRAAFRALTCPVLCVLGEHDPLVPAAVADALMALNPRLQVARIAGAGHAPFISHPTEFVSVVREFCDGL